MSLPRHSSGKPPNKTGRPAAEAMEQRAGSEENAEPAKHVPDTEPGKRVTDAGPRTDGRKALPSNYPRWEPDAGCDRRSRYELASASLVRPKLSKRDGSEFCGRRGNAGSEA